MDVDLVVLISGNLDDVVLVVVVVVLCEVVELEVRVKDKDWAHMELLLLSEVDDVTVSKVYLKLKLYILEGSGFFPKNKNSGL